MTNLLVLLYDYSQASMGPRLFSRGMDVTQRQMRLPFLWLQWGRDFSAAEWTSTSTTGTTTRTASMGPRLFSRGMAGVEKTLLAGLLLQWGRDFSAAEWC